MAPLRLLCVLALVAVAVAKPLASSEGDTGISAQVEKAEKLGQSLPALLQKQWTDRLAQQKEIFSSAMASLLKTIPAQAKGAAAALAALDKVETKIVANITAFSKLQNKETLQIVKLYGSLLKQRLGAKSTEETPIHQIRQQSQAVVNKWAAQLSQVHRFAHQVFESTVRQIATEAAKKSENPQLGDQVRVAVTNVGIQLLNDIINQQNADINLLTGKQYGVFNDYFQQAETALIQMLVAAKNAKPAQAQNPSTQTLP